MDQQQFYTPKAKNQQPKGQLAAMLQSKGAWDDFSSTGQDINRSSSAPPSQLIMQDNDFDEEDLRNNPDYAKYYHQNSRLQPRMQPPNYSPAQSWQLWAPPGMNSKGENFSGYEKDQVNNNLIKSPTLFAPNAVNSASKMNPSWGTNSPLRGLPNQEMMNSPLRHNLTDLDSEQYPRASSVLSRPKSSNQNFIDHYDTQEDEMRMTALLNAALDSQDNVFAAPIPRAASTPPTRLQFAPSKRDPTAQEIIYGMQNMDVKDEPVIPNRSRTPISRHFPDGPASATKANFGDAFSPGYTSNIGDRKGPNRLFDHDSNFFPNRPASAQGRFSNPNSPARGAPPGLVDKDKANDVLLDPAMAQALAALSAAGNLSPLQIQQIQMQLRLTQNNNNNANVNQWEKTSSHQQPPRQESHSRRDGYQNNSATSPTRNRMDASPTSNQDSSPSSRSALLEDFRNNKNKKYELKDIAGSVVEFSGDQHGSRFIQQKLETATNEEKQMVFEEILPHALQLTTDVFGNYVIQKFFEHGNAQQKEELASKMEGNILNLSLQMYGCRVVQKAFEYVSPEQQSLLIKELEGNVLKCVKDQNGNHVIQKAVERVDPDHIRFIIDAFHGQVYALATHPYGCRVIQRIFEHCSDEETEPLLEELHRYAISLIQDQYGNYVIQHILEKGKPKDKQFVISKVKGHVLNMSKHKFASNVVEKCVSYGSPQDRQEIIDEVIHTKQDGTTPLYTMMKDQFANYVVQKLLDVANESQKLILVTKIKPQLPSLKKYTYGKHLISKVEKYIVQYQID